MKKLLSSLTFIIAFFPASYAQQPEFYKNPANPYDYVGQKHNEGELFVLKELQPFSKVTVQQIIGETDLFLKDGMAKKIGLKIVSDKSFPGQTSVRFSKSTQNYVDKIRRLFEQGLGYNEFLKSVKAAEAQIIKDKNLSEYDMVLILCATTVSRYSTWLNIGEQTASFKIKINWGKVKADFEGACAGAGLGGICGPGCAVGGAVAGAIIGSSAAKLQETKNLILMGQSLRSYVWDEKKDFSWTNDITKQLGYTTIVFKKGSYRISEDGSVTLNISTVGKNISSEKQLINSITLFNPRMPFHWIGDCTCFGFSCGDTEKYPGSVGFILIRKEGVPVALTVSFKEKGAPINN